jgi:hypothetical protein
MKPGPVRSGEGLWPAKQGKNGESEDIGIAVKKEEEKGQTEPHTGGGGVDCGRQEVQSSQAFQAG